MIGKTISTMDRYQLPEKHDDLKRVLDELKKAETDAEHKADVLDTLTALLKGAAKQEPQS